MVSATKDPIKVRAGAIGARVRWADHAPQIVRLDELTPPQRRLVLALVAAAKQEATTVSETSVVASGGGTRDADSAA